MAIPTKPNMIPPIANPRRFSLKTPMKPMIIAMSETGIPNGPTMNCMKKEITPATNEIIDIIPGSVFVVGVTWYVVVAVVEYGVAILVGCIVAADAAFSISSSKLAPQF